MGQWNGGWLMNSFGDGRHLQNELDEGFESPGKAKSPDLFGSFSS
jgi:hypothetical protein